MLERYFRRAGVILLISLPILTVLIIGWVRVTAPPNPPLSIMEPIQPQQALAPRLLHGQVASLGWIVGRDCQRGIQAYLQTASTNPDAALVGTGWVNPTNGHLMNGESNNCMAGSLSMENVVQLVHSKGGMAYLTVTMETDGTTGSWTSQQQSDYIGRATTDQSFIDPIIREVKQIGRAHV